MIHTVTIERLSKKIRGTVVLQDVGMRLESGKVYGLVGDNGSGKTMLMRAICGLILPDSGKSDLTASPGRRETPPSER